MVLIQLRIIERSLKRYIFPSKNQFSSKNLLKLDSFVRKVDEAETEKMLK